MYHSAVLLRSVKCVPFYGACEHCASQGKACSLLPASSEHDVLARSQTPSSDGTGRSGDSEPGEHCVRAVPLVPHAGGLSPHVTKEVDMEGEGPEFLSRCNLKTSEADETCAVRGSLLFEPVCQGTELPMHSRFLLSVLPNRYTGDP